jgi:hypothetical protein
MKLYFAAAGALLLGTSAMAWAPAEKMDSKWVEAGSKMSLISPERTPNDQLKVAVLDAQGDAKAEQLGLTAWGDGGFKAEPAAWTAEAPKLQPASASWMEDAPKLQPASAGWIEDAPKLKLASTDPAEDGPALDNADIAFGDWKADDGAAVEKADAGGEEEMAEDTPADVNELETPLSPVENSGVGGPEEAIAGDLTPRPAAQNYPPCDPGPGDDNCIQLYEPGVRTALASWSAPTGGLIGSDTATAMGGPFEPADSAMKTADASIATEHHDPGAGMGGPARETGYPPCSGSPSDDRCIQLYEPGVTGAGN